MDTLSVKKEVIPSIVSLLGSLRVSRLDISSSRRHSELAPSTLTKPQRLYQQDRDLLGLFRLRRFVTR